jgi:hypothetical protein
MSEGVQRRRLLDRLRPLPVVFAITAEAAWVWVAAGLVQEYALSPVGIGLAPLVVVVAAGAVASHLLAGRVGARWPLVATGLAMAVGAVGWLAAEEARAALADGAPARALGLNPGGWLAAVAFVRGYRHARLPLHEGTLATMVALGVPGLAFAALVGGMIAEPFRSRFLADALLGATLFAASSTVALALARLSAAGADAGFDWRRNPPWLLVVVVLIAAVAIVAPPAAAVAGPLITLLIGLIAGPLLVVALVVGFTRRTAWFMFIAGGVTLVYVGLVALFLGDPAEPPADAGSGVAVIPPERATEDALAVAGFILLLAAVAIAILVRLWMRRTPEADADPDETRTIDRGETIRPLARRRRRWRVSAPTDAVSAYRALDAELARHAPVARERGETPAEHARRLRTAGDADLGLELLAADYALVRFGGVELSAAEEHRAVERWRRLRRLAAGRSARRTVPRGGQEGRRASGR